MAAKLAIEGGAPVRDEPFPHWPVYGEEEIELIAKILRTGNTHVARSNVSSNFEQRFAAWTGVKHAICCNSGTSAIHMALAALGIGPGDEVIVPPRTFIGSVSPVLYQNAVPIFADIDPQTHNMAPDAVRQAVTERTRAIVPVHLSGVPCDMDALTAIAGAHDLHIIEDCAQAHGAEYKGRKVGGFGTVNAFSMQDSKIVNTTGDGGMVTTDDDTHALFCREFRNHGFAGGLKKENLNIYIHPRIGYNYRLTEIQAAAGLKSLDRADAHIEQRRQNALYLTREIPGIEGLSPMYEPPNVKASYYVYYVTIDVNRFRVERDQFVKALLAENIACRIGTNPEIYRQEIFTGKLAHSWDPRIYDGKASYEGTLCPVAAKVGRETFALEVAPPAATRDMRDTLEALRKVAEAYRK